MTAMSPALATAARARDLQERAAREIGAGQLTQAEETTAHLRALLVGSGMLLVERVIELEEAVAKGGGA